MIDTEGRAKSALAVLTAPFSTMSGAALFLVAGSRLSFALVAAGAVALVFAAGAAAERPAWCFTSRPYRRLCNMLAAALAGGVYLFALHLFFPLLALECGLVCAIVPAVYMESGADIIRERPPSRRTPGEAALTPIGLVMTTLAVALVREPLAYGTLTMPTEAGGLTEVWRIAGFLPVRVIASTTGALLLFAYGAAAFQYLGRGRNKGGER
jgi:hypothetical protein